jgi:hypothetical protein
VAEANRRGIKRVALLTQDYPSIDNHVRALRAEATNVGIVVVYADRFAATTTDFSARIAAAKATAPDVYFVEAFNPALDLLGQQLKDADVGDLTSIVAFSAKRAAGIVRGRLVYRQLCQSCVQGAAGSAVSGKQAGHAHDAVCLRLVQHAGAGFRER